MTCDELNEEQKLELKQHILMERNDAKGEGTSYDELANADEPVDIVEDIPQWAVCYLVNSDDSGMSPEDKKLVDDYEERLLEREGLRLVCPINGTENEFCRHPAFGFACDTVDFYARQVQKPWRDRDWDKEALQRAETIGVCEYSVNGRFMEYWSFFGKGEGWYFVRYDLGAEKETFRGANIPWNNEAQIPAFLKTETGATRYNYMVG